LYQNSKIREQSAPLLFSQPRNQNQSIHNMTQFVFCLISLFPIFCRHPKFSFFMALGSQRRIFRLLRAEGHICPSLLVKSYRMPFFYRSLSAKESYNLWLFCGKRSATSGGVNDIDTFVRPCAFCVRFD